MLGELALAEEAVGDTGSADARFTQSVDLLAAEYPETTALASARARYASFLTRHAQDDKAIGIYREVVTALANSQRSTAGMANVMAPYYRLLANRAATDPAAVGDFFVPRQLHHRPGAPARHALLAPRLPQE